MHRDKRNKTLKAQSGKQKGEGGCRGKTFGEWQRPNEEAKNQDRIASGKKRKTTETQPRLKKP